MADVLIAPEYREINGPVIFLAGPIRGAQDWQADAIEHLKKRGDSTESVR